MLSVDVDYDTSTIKSIHEEDYARINEILNEDKNALFLNGYYYMLGVSDECPEHSSLSNLIAWLKRHYEIQRTRLKDYTIEIIS